MSYYFRFSLRPLLSFSTKECNKMNPIFSFWRQFFLAKGKGLSLERTLNEALVLLAAFALINAQTDPQSHDSCGNNRSCLQPRFTYVFWPNEMIINLFFDYPEMFFIF